MICPLPYLYRESGNLKWKTYPVIYGTCITSKKMKRVTISSIHYKQDAASTEKEEEKISISLDKHGFQGAPKS